MSDLEDRIFEQAKAKAENSTPEVAPLTLEDRIFNQAAANMPEGLQQSIEAGKTKDPEQYGKANKLSRSTGLPVDVVESDIPRAEALTEPKYDIRSFAAANPVAAKWLTRPANAAVSHDILGDIGKIEEELKRQAEAREKVDERKALLQKWKDEPNKLVAYEPSMWERFKAFFPSDKDRATVEIATKRMAEESGKTQEEVYQSIGGTRPTINPEGAAPIGYATEATSKVVKQLPDVPQGVLNATLRSVRGGDTTVEETGIDRLIKMSEPESDPLYQDDNFKAFEGIAKSLGFSLASLGPQVVAGLAGTAATGPAGGIASGMAAGGAVAFRGSKDEYLDRIKEKANKQSMLLHGRPITQEEWDVAYEEANTAANKYGAWEAIPEAVGNLMMLKVITAPLKGAAKEKILEVGKRALTAQAPEHLTETITGVGQSYAEMDGGLAAKPKTFTEAFNEQMVQTAILGSIMGGGSVAVRSGYDAITGLVGQKAIDTADGLSQAANEYASGQDTLDKIVSLSQQLINRDDVAGAELISEFQDEYGIDDIYVDGAEMQRVMEEAEMDLSDPEVMALYAQTQDESTGRDVVIPLGEYMTKYAGLESLRPHVRLSADGLSQNELINAPAERDNVLSRMLSESQKNIEDSEASKALYEGVKDQLFASGTLSKKESGLAAELFPAIMQQHATKRGISLQEAYETIPGIQVSQAEAQPEVVLRQAQDEGYQGDDVQEASEWSQALEKYGAEGMTEEARMQRAKDMGFDTERVAYHGTAKSGYVDTTDIEAFDEDKIGDRWSADQSGFFFTSRKSFASDYATSDNDYSDKGSGEGAIYPVYLKTERPLVIDKDFLNEEGMQEIGVTEDTISFWDVYQGQIFEWMEEGDYDSVILVDSHDKSEDGKPTQTTVVFDSSQIRSINAAFDTDKADSANILAQPAYHGTPHSFDSFSLSAMGSGEGNQAFGWGLYFAEKRGIAESYRETLAEDMAQFEREMVFIDAVIGITDTDARILNRQIDKGLSPEEAVMAASDIFGANSDLIDSNMGALVEAASKSKAIADKGYGTLFKVDIPESDVLLYWDKPFNEQPEYVKKKLGREPEFNSDVTGGESYRNLQEILGSDKAVSDYLGGLGVQGLQFLDAGSRKEGAKKSYNYVIWDDRAIEVLAKKQDPLTELNQSPIDQTETPEFKAWFGDSKAVDEDGKPVVVYHGTASEFDVFEESEQGKVTGAESAKNAIFFSDDEATAKAYSVYAAEDAPVKEALRKADEAEARDDWDAYDKHLEEAERLEGDAYELRKNAKVLSTYLKIENPLIVDAQGMTPQDLSDSDNVDSWLSNQIQAAKDGGHDGLIMRNLDDAVGLYDQSSNHYVVFDSNQVKSATDNVGTFDPNNPSILFQSEAKTVDDLQADLLDRYDLKTLFLSEKASSGDISVGMIEVNPDSRKSGVGSSVMNEIVAYADAVGKRVRLTPGSSDDLHGTTSKARLKRFYKRFGFVENKGRNKDFTINADEMYREPIALKQEKRASVGFSGTNYLVSLGKKSDRSSFLHEAGHIFLDIERVFADKYGVTEEQEKWLAHLGAESFDDIDFFKWAGIQTRVMAGDTSLLDDYGLTQDELSAKVDAARDSHEQFAEEFETYLMEGKAPSVGLREAFRNFKDWLVAVYRGMKINGITLSRDVKGMFDRLLASEEEIAAMQAVYGFDATPDGNVSGKAKAKETLESKLFKQWKRQTEKWWKDELSAEIEQRINDYKETRLYAAEAALSENKVNAQQAGEALGYRDEKVTQSDDVDSAVDTISIAVAKLGGIDRSEAEGHGIDPATWKGRLNNNTPIFGKPIFRKSGGDTFDGMARRIGQYGFTDDPHELLELIEADLNGEPQYSVDVDYDTLFPEDTEIVPMPKRLYGLTEAGGVDIDLAATSLGYKSGDQMLRDIAASKPIAIAASDDAKAFMLDKYGDILNDGTLEQEARLAVHNEEQGKQLLVDLRVMNNQNRKPTLINIDMLKRAAEDAIDGLKVKDVKPERYHRAEVKAAQEVARLQAEGDSEGAIQEKMNQLLNFYLYRQALDVKAKSEKWRKHNQGIKTRKYSAGSVNSEYINQMKVYANAFDFRRSPSPSAVNDLRGLALWIQAQAETNPDGYRPQFYHQVLADLANPDTDLDSVTIQSYADMTVSELRATYDTLVHLRFIGGKLSDNDKAQVRLKADSVAASIIENAGADKPKHKHGRKGGGFKRGLADFGWSQARAFLHIQEMDGWKKDAANGELYKAIWQTILDASDVNVALKMEMAEKVKAVLNVDRLRDKSTKTYKSAMGDEFALELKERIMFAVYWGSPESRETLLDTGADGQALTEAEAQKILDSLTDEDIKIVRGIWKLNESLKARMFQTQRDVHGVAPKAVEALPYSIRGQVMEGGYMRIRYEWDAKDTAGRDDSMSEAQRGIGNAGVAMTKAGSMNERVGSGGRELSLNIHSVTQALEESVQFISFAKTSVEVHKIMNDKAVKNALVTKYGMERYKAFIDSLNGTFAGDVVGQTGGSGIARFMRKTRSNMSMAMLMFSVRNIVQQFVGGTNLMVELKSKDYLSAAGDFMADRNKWVEFVNERSPMMRYRMALTNKEVSDAAIGLEASATNNWLVDRGYLAQTMIDKAVSMPAWLAGYRKGLGIYNDEKLAAQYADEIVVGAMGSGQAKDLAPMFSGAGQGGNQVAIEAMKQLAFMGSFFNMVGQIYYKAYKTNDLKTVEGITEFSRQIMWTLLIPAIVSALVVDDIPDEEPVEQWAARKVASYGLGSIMLVREVGGFLDSGFAPSQPISNTLKAAGQLVKTPTEVMMGEKEMDGKAAIRMLRDVTPFLPLPGAYQVARMVQGIMDDEQGIYDALVEGKERNE